MSEEMVSIEDLSERLIAICNRIIDELLGRTTFSLAFLIEQVGRYIISAHTSLSPEGKERIRAEAEFLVKYLNDFRDYYFGTVRDFLRAIEKIERMPKREIELLVSHIISCLRRITNEVINGWLVRRVREVRKINEDLFDRYNTFKEKWNGLLEDIERLVSEYGFSIREIERAKELGVPIG